MTVIPSQEGQKVKVLSDRVCIKLKSSHSPNSMAVVTVEVPPGSLVPPHIHTQEEESYYMLDGSMVLQMGSEEFTIEPNDFVHIPPGTIHGYRNDSDRPIHFLAWAVGGAIDDFFIEMGEKIREIPNDFPKMPEILDKYGIQMATPTEC
jgi:quercetin dioxygenase-like cupin family protein